MTGDDLLSRLGVALAVGLLVGLERGWRTREEDDHKRAAGLRTFGLTGLLGGVAGALGQRFGGLFVGLVFLGHAVAFTAFHWLEARAERNFSATSVVAGLSTFLLGALAVAGDLGAAIAGAVAMTVLLALREPLHRWVATLTWEEIRAVLTLLVMTFLLLPILPDRAIDPWGALEPRAIWLFAIMIAGVSFAGYIAVHMFGDRWGLIVAAMAGGLASSTATTLTLARLVPGRPDAAPLVAGGILAAALVMVARVVVLALAVNPAVVVALVKPLAAAALVMAVAIAWLVASRREAPASALLVENPLEIGAALKFAAFIAVILLATKLARAHLGDAGLMAAAALSGLADVDAVVISMARMAVADIDAALAARGVLLAVAVNTVVKSALALSVGGAAVGLRVAAVNAAAVAAGWAAMTM